MILAESPRRQRVTKLVNWGHWFALANILMALIISSIFIFSSPVSGHVIGSVYFITNWLGHIGFLTFCGFVIFILPQCYWVKSPNIIKGSSAFIAAVGLALLAFDALIYNRTGFHITFSSAELVRSAAQNQISTFTWQEWSFFLLLFIVWFSFQLVLANAIWKRIERLVKHKIGAPFTSLFLVCFVTSHAMHVWADANLYQPIIKQDNMFPLSYPATAKTLLSRYELLDLDNYQQRKQLQFDPNLQSINYPLSSIYCSVDATKSTAVFVQTDTAQIRSLNALDLRKSNQHYASASNLMSLVNSTLYGVPEIYTDTLRSKTPILIEMAEAFEFPIVISTEPTFLTNSGSATVSNDALASVNAIVGGKLIIVFAKAAEIEQWLSIPQIAKSHLLIATGFDPNNHSKAGSLYSTADIQQTVSGTEDILPTLLAMMGCSADPGLYSTGQNLIEPVRNWLVSTSGERIVMIHEGLRTEVMSNGSYEITEVVTGNRSTDSLNTDLLSQAIKHLSRFSKPQ
jgi:hypothetical protein